MTGSTQSRDWFSVVGTMIRISGFTLCMCVYILLSVHLLTIAEKEECPTMLEAFSHLISGICKYINHYQSVCTYRGEELTPTVKLYCHIPILRPCVCNYRHDQNSEHSIYYQLGMEANPQAVMNKMVVFRKYCW